LTWAGSRTDTLILVAADHETGGLTVGSGPYTAGVKPSVTWSTTGHTQTPVGVWATGPNADMVTGTLDNVDLFNIMTAPEPCTTVLLAAGALAVLRRRRG